MCSLWWVANFQAMKPVRVSVSRPHSGAYSLEWSKGAVWLITLCRIPGARGHVGLGVRAAKPSPNIGGVVVIRWSMGVAMVMQSFRGQVSTSWSGVGCCLLTERL